MSKNIYLLRQSGVQKMSSGKPETSRRKLLPNDLRLIGDTKFHHNQVQIRLQRLKLSHHDPGAALGQIVDQTVECERVFRQKRALAINQLARKARAVTRRP